MGKSTPSAPAAPNPAATSAAQTQSNKETALYNYGLSNQNYNTPLGNINYSVNTSNPNQPQGTANVTLSPEQQQLYNQQTQQSIGLSNLADQLQGRVGDTLNQPGPGSADFATTAKNASDAYYANQKQYLDPQWEQQQKQNNAMLANQGIQMGSEAYDTAQNNFARQKQSAYDTAQQNAILQGPQNTQQLFSLNSAARELPLNEFNALRSQSQVQMPSFAAPTPVSAAGTNTAQNTWNAYNAQQNSYNQQVASQNNQMSSLFGLGGQLGAAWLMSDERLKTDIRPLKNINGFWFYNFKYLGDDAVYSGVMAQDVQLLHPDAVIVMPNGYLAVDYAKIGMIMERVH